MASRCQYPESGGSGVSPLSVQLAGTGSYALYEEAWVKEPKILLLLLTGPLTNDCILSKRVFFF